MKNIWPALGLFLLIAILAPRIGSGESAKNPSPGTEATASGVQTSKPAPRDPTSSVPQLHAWLVDRMKKWSPAGRSFIKDAKETKEEGEARYSEIASAAISVVYDPSEKPIVEGKNARAKSLAILMSLSWFESGFRRDVDFGIGSLGRGDSGKSWCMVQVLLGPPNGSGKTTRRVVLGPDGTVDVVTDKSATLGWGGEDLVADRTKCYRVGMRLLRKSFRSCSGQAFEDRISTYGAGKCLKNWEPSRVRVERAKRWLAESPPPMGDQTVISALFPTTPTSGPAPKPASSVP